MNEESQVRGCFYLHPPGNSVGSPLNQMHRQQLELLLTDDLLLQGHWGKRTRRAQHTSFNTLDNWGHKTPTQSKRRKDSKEKIKGSWPGANTIHSFFPLSSSPPLFFSREDI